MKKVIFTLFLLFFFLSPSASADTEISPTVAVSYSVQPQALLPGDIGTVTFEMQNMADGAVYVEEDDETFDMNAYLAGATLKGDGDVLSGGTSYTDVGLLGPGDSLSLTFNIKASENASAGTHYLNLEVVGGSDMSDLNYKIPVKVDDREVRLIVDNLPGIAINEICEVSVDVVNPGAGDVTGVTVIPHGEGVSIKPEELFVGTVKAGDKATANFTLNTMDSHAGLKDVYFTTDYYNGDNKHTSISSNSAIDIVERPSLIFTNLEIIRQGESYSVSGDINNFGTTQAKNIIVSIMESDSVTPLQPYASYFVGTLEEDDFSSFELSARVESGNVSSIPVMIEFRDTDNAYASITDEIPLEGSAISFSSEYSSSDTSENMPVTYWAALVLVLAVIGFVIYRSWKRSTNEEDEGEEDDELYS
ncbi:hypothetical protein EFE42_09225 [Methanohalophilus sp. RSK]|uniref:COG1361 S-layer family protein n=1 Tax=Methanohalophilus sp. RSK TaxID=2485783 RepID=UPI000F439661|nr:hypothetical protein [Methanohalophilus sp. RSK]RNI12063.1 hypothetical protein EFE42_09225 [Methanohalophilus sp. RSK]